VTTSYLNPSTNKIDYNSLVYAYSSNVLILILLVSIVSGIIIDTFANLREQENEIENDNENLCFICGKTKD
jgi:hypothetical protein